MLPPPLPSHQPYACMPQRLSVTRSACAAGTRDCAHGSLLVAAK
jgi:hypothetical protein